MMTDVAEPFEVTLALASRLIADQFPEFADLSMAAVKKQGHDNRTFRIGNGMLIRLPTQGCYALAVHKEQQFLPFLAPCLPVQIPVPLRLGQPCADYPFHFLICRWIPGESADGLAMDDNNLVAVARPLAQFLKALQGVDSSGGPPPGLHNWYRGAHIAVYDREARLQIAELANLIDSEKALALWEKAMHTKWQKPPVWIHGDFAAGNILVKEGKLAAVIDFGCSGLGDPACDLVIAWTLLKDRSRALFMREMGLDEVTWLRAKAWALWKATFELCQITDKNSAAAAVQRRVIAEVLGGS